MGQCGDRPTRDWPSGVASDWSWTCAKYIEGTVLVGDPLTKDWSSEVVVDINI